MKSFNKQFLPDSITYNGDIYELNAGLSSSVLANNTRLSHVTAQLKLQGRKAIVVNCLNKTLRGKTDLYGKPYQPTQHIFTTIERVDDTFTDSKSLG